VENLSALLTRGLDAVLGTLASLGYDAEWHCIPAAAVGAPHIRDRIFILAYSQCNGCGPRRAERKGQQREPPPINASGDVANTSGKRVVSRDGGRRGVCRSGTQATTNASRQDSRALDIRHDVDDGGYGRTDMADACGQGLEASEQETVFGTWRRNQGRATPKCGWWSVEPDVGRVANGVPSRVDRLRCLGNAVVPQVAEWIGHQIMAFEDSLIA
jgi:DNA (cytosine-5)-methyltransferase 1